MSILKMRMRVFVCVAAGLLVSGGAVCSAGSAFYVAPDGDDSNAGTLNKPFATITRARDAVRKVNAAMDSDIHVYIRKGTYYLKEGIKLDPRDGGRSGHFVIYSGYRDERPVLIAGKPVKGWEPCKDAALKKLGVMRANVGRGTEFWSLMVNGKRAQMARAGRGWQKMAPFPTRNVQGYYCGRWMAEYVNVTGFGTNGQAIVEFPKSKYTGRWVTPCGYYKFIRNKGDWALDSDEGYLYYLPKDKSDLEQVVYPTSHSIFRVAGKSEREPVANIRIENIDMKLTDFNASMRCYSGITENGYEYSSVDRANTIRTALVSIENANRIEVRFCDMSEAPIMGVSIYGAAQSNLVYGCRIHDVGYVGVYLAGYKLTRTSPYNNKFNTVCNNEIFNIAGTVNHTSGVYIYQSGDNEISHNMLYHSKRYAISVKGIRYRLFKNVGLGDVKFDDKWNYLHSNRNRIVGNYVFDLCRDSVDGGGIESWGGGRDNLVESNIVVNAYMAKPTNGLRGRSIFMDDGSDYWTLRNNICWNTRLPSLNSSIYMCGVGEVVINNVFDVSECSMSGIMLDTYCERGGQHVVRQNVLFSSIGKEIKRNGTAGGPIKQKSMLLFRKRILESAGSNLVYAVHGTPVFCQKTGKYTSDCMRLDEWRKYDKGQYGKGSRIADPKFVDWKERDYRLREDSPALDMGIRSIDMDEIGLLADYPFAPAKDPLKLVALKANGEDVYLEAKPGDTIKLGLSGRTEKWYVAKLDGAQVRYEVSDTSILSVDHGVVSLKGTGRGVVKAIVTLDGVTKSDEVVIYSGIRRAEWRAAHGG